jgi:hypothetical protein
MTTSVSIMLVTHVFLLKIHAYKKYKTLMVDTTGLKKERKKGNRSTWCCRSNFGFMRLESDTVDTILKINNKINNKRKLLLKTFNCDCVVKEQRNVTTNHRHVPIKISNNRNCSNTVFNCQFNIVNGFEQQIIGGRIVKRSIKICWVSG